MGRVVPLDPRDLPKLVQRELGVVARSVGDLGTAIEGVEGGRRGVATAVREGRRVPVVVVAVGARRGIGIRVASHMRGHQVPLVVGPRLLVAFGLDQERPVAVVVVLVLGRPRRAGGDILHHRRQLVPVRVGVVGRDPGVRTALRAVLVDVLDAPLGHVRVAVVLELDTVGERRGCLGLGQAAERVEGPRGRVAPRVGHRGDITGVVVVVGRGDIEAGGVDGHLFEQARLEARRVVAVGGDRPLLVRGRRQLAVPVVRGARAGRLRRRVGHGLEGRGRAVAVAVDRVRGHVT